MRNFFPPSRKRKTLELFVLSSFLIQSNGIASEVLPSDQPIFPSSWLHLSTNSRKKVMNSLVGGWDFSRRLFHLSNRVANTSSTHWGSMARASQQVLQRFSRGRSIFHYYYYSLLSILSMATTTSPYELFPPHRVLSAFPAAAIGKSRRTNMTMATGRSVRWEKKEKTFVSPQDGG